MKTSSRARPASPSSWSRNLPDRPTNGRPCLSSLAPGASPTSITSAVSLPSPGTMLVAAAQISNPHLPWARSSFLFRVSRSSMSLHPSPLDGPTTQLVPVGELELAQDRGHVRLDRLGGDAEPQGDLLVHVAAGDVAQDLALPRGELVELGVRHGRRRPLLPGERVEHEAGEPRREHRVPARHAVHGVRQLRPGDRLGHVAAGAGPDDRDHVLGRVGDAQREEADGRAARRDAADHLGAAAVGHLHVEEDDVGLGLHDQLDRLAHGAGVPGDVDQPVELGAHPGPEQSVVVDQHRAGERAHPPITSSTSVPSPGRVWIAALPPWRSIRPSTDSRSPRRSAGTASRSKPGPRSRTNTSARPPSTSANTLIAASGANLTALRTASRAAATSASPAASSGRSPTATTSIGTPCASSTSATAASSAPARVASRSRSEPLSQ